MNGPALTARAKTLIAANSEMAALIRAFDWARTPLGPIEGWSAMPTGGVLAISVEDVQESEDGIRLTIQDDGVGIAADDLPKVFDAFFTTRTTVGTGIGLFVAKQFVEGHGGRIDIESRNRSEDQGTAVRVFLPISTAYDAPDN
jgi:signal transduction histidine kinase